MELEGIPADEASFACIILGCSHKGDLHDGWSKVRSLILDHSVRLTKQLYCSITDLLSRAGYLREAEEILSGMPFTPDVVDWRCLLGACKRQEDTQSGAQAARQALVASPEDPSSCVLLANVVSV
ncbi:hypothetical protein SELMODRAFT_91636 [Selaginella moellendorffii]|uniref:Pentatricopeptide repeat-containing protein n=2 Tax=Selaginella moellendorffii TaxID=88036 RepID=D8RE27_SELML|nr:hypothetical protein SELMODRAFT_91636 [Selaginella moellendorffii]